MGFHQSRIKLDRGGKSGAVHDAERDEYCRAVKRERKIDAFV